MVTELGHNSDWAMEKLYTGHNVRRLAWPETRFIAEVYVLSEKQYQALREEIWADLEECNEWLATPGEERKTTIARFDMEFLEETIMDWKPTQEDIDATDWVAEEEVLAQ